jgi:hypothetical protein
MFQELQHISAHPLLLNSSCKNDFPDVGKVRNVRTLANGTFWIGCAGGCCFCLELLRKCQSKTVGGWEYYFFYWWSGNMLGTCSDFLDDILDVYVHFFQNLESWSSRISSLATFKSFSICLDGSAIERASRTLSQVFQEFLPSDTLIQYVPVVVVLANMRKMAFQFQEAPDKIQSQHSHTVRYKMIHWTSSIW